MSGPLSILSFYLGCLLFPCFAASQGIYGGGPGNGVTATSINLNLSITDSLYNGGNGDGFHQISQNLDLTITDSSYNGGFGDGFNQISQNIDLTITDSLYNGGYGDGFNLNIQEDADLSITDSLYNGGNGKGETRMYLINADLSIPCSGVVIYWNGSVSTVWGGANNWDCGVVPDVNSIVIIPSGKTRYPSLSASRQIKKLILEQGASLILANGGFLNITGF